MTECDNCGGEFDAKEDRPNALVSVVVDDGDGETGHAKGDLCPVCVDEYDVEEVVEA